MKKAAPQYQQDSPSPAKNSTVLHLFAAWLHRHPLAVELLVLVVVVALITLPEVSK